MIHVPSEMVVCPLSSCSHAVQPQMPNVIGHCGAIG